MTGDTGEQPAPSPDPFELLKDKSYVALLLMKALIGVPVAAGRTPAPPLGPPGGRNRPTLATTAHRVVASASGP